MSKTRGKDRRGALVALPVLVAIAACLALSGCGGGAPATASDTLPSFPGGDAVPAKPAPPLRLTDYRGHRVNLAALRGRPVLVAFLYTHCKDLCPIVAAKVHTTDALLGSKRKRPVFLAVSVDPAHDTPASARKFNHEHRTSGEIDWLLGSQAELASAWKAWGVVPKREKNNPEVIEHSADIYGIGPDGDLEALFPPSFKPAQLAHSISVLASQ